jgi:predicted nucleotidyltransferase
MLDFSGSTTSELARAGQVIGAVDQVARSLGIGYVVVGATARDILAAVRPDRVVQRMTRDVDVVVAVSSWQEFEHLATRLPGRGRQAHRFEIEGTPVDVVPCGPIESPERTITWPDDFVMNTLGLYEAMEGALDVRLPGPVNTRVLSVPGLAGLKLLSWYGRRASTRHDAVDLGTLLAWSERELVEPLFGQHLDLLLTYEVDTDRASAHQLGAEIAGLLGPAAAEAIRFILQDDRLRRNLAHDLQLSRLDPQGILVALREGLSDPARAGAVDGWP